MFSTLLLHQVFSVIQNIFVFLQIFYGSLTDFGKIFSRQCMTSTMFCIHLKYRDYFSSIFKTYKTKMNGHHWLHSAISVAQIEFFKMGEKSYATWVERMSFDFKHLFIELTGTNNQWAYFTQIITLQAI